MRIPTRWLSDGYWSGEYDRWRARFDLLLVLPRADGRVRVCVRELAGRWHWSPRRVRRCVETLVAEGYLVHEHRQAYGVIYRLCEALVDDLDMGEIAEPMAEVVADAEAGVGVDTKAGAGANAEAGVAAAANPMVGVPPEGEGLKSPHTSPQPRPSPFLHLTPSERSVAAEVFKTKPQIIDQMLAVWVEFKDVRRRCLEAMEHEVAGCRLTQRRAVKILAVLASAGEDIVLEAVGNLPFSHWHCGTGRHVASGTKLCPEAVFTAQQVQILSEIPERVPVWRQPPARSSPPQGTGSGGPYPPQPNPSQPYPSQPSTFRRVQPCGAY